MAEEREVVEEREVTTYNLVVPGHTQGDLLKKVSYGNHKLDLTRTYRLLQAYSLDPI